MAATSPNNSRGGRDVFSVCRFILQLVILALVVALFYTVVKWFYIYFIVYKPVNMMETPVRLCNSCGTSRIPKIVHHTWANSSVPVKWQKTYNSCLDAHKGYKHILWTDRELEIFLENFYPWFMNTYLNYPYNIQRVDAARYFIMYHYGGVYIDLDIGCNISTHTIMTDLDRYNVLLAATTPTGVTNQYMAATAQHPLFKHAIYHLSRANRWYGSPYPTVMFSTGPMYLTGIVSQLKLNDIYILPVLTIFTQYFWRVDGSSWHRWDSYLFWKVHEIWKMSTSWFIVIICSVVVSAMLYFSYKKILPQRRNWYAFLNSNTSKVKPGAMV